LWKNKQRIAEIIGGILIAVLCYWFFYHNPKVIKELQEDKKELARIVEAKDKQITLYKDIEKGKVKIDGAIQSQISSLRAVARPRRTIIIHAGRVLSPLSNGGTSNGTSPANDS
jgi:plastocyanin domain-containing protein